MDQYTFLILLLISLFAIVLRILPHKLTKYGLGVDHWFWKKYIKEYRQNREFPPVLKQFLLDEKQWYPPIFPLFVNLFPTFIFDRYSHLIAIAIDMLRFLLLLVMIYIFTGRANSMFFGACIYALTPILITYNIQLNPRGLGALFLDIIVLSTFYLIITDIQAWWAWTLVLFFSGLVLLTHKMTTQLMWFLFFVVGVLTLKLWVIAFIPLSMLIATLLSKGFYIKVLIAHWDIVSFWYRNWRWLSAHPINSSPIYGKGNTETAAGFFKHGWEGELKRLWFIAGFNPWLYAAFTLAVWALLANIQFSNEVWWVLLWLTIIFIFIIITTYISVFRCLGVGYLYLYNAAFPVAFFISIIWGGLTHSWWINLILVASLSACITGIGFYYYTLKDRKTLSVNQDLDKAIQFLNTEPEGTVLCLPLHWNDLVAYKTKKNVLSGAHGYGFRKIEFIFPRWTSPVKDVVSKYHLKYLLTYETFLPENFIREFKIEKTHCFGEYRLHVINH